MRKLSPKQRDFAYYYAMMEPDDKKSGEKAAIKAGYSEKTAAVISSQNLKKLNIVEAIEKHQETFRKEAERNHNIITPIELLESYTRDILFDPIDLVDEEGRLRTINEIPKEARLSLAGMEVTEMVKMGNEEEALLSRKTKYKFSDKNRPRDSVAKILGLANNGHGKEVIPAWLSEFLRNLLGLQKDDSSESKAVEIQAGLRILVNSVDGLTRGIPSQPKLIEVDNG